MTSLRVVLLALAFISVASRLQAQRAMEFARATVLWEARDFAAAYEALVIYRSQDFGRSFEVDFMLGTSACRIAEKRERGAAFLEWTLRAYADRLTSEGIGIVHRELQNCTGVGSPSNGTVPRLQQVVTAGGRYQGKTFYWLDQQSQDALGSHLTAGVVPVPLAVLVARQIRLGDRSGAERIASSAMPNGATQAVFARFVITSEARHTAAQLADANRILERYLDFFVRSYGMSAPDRYIFVYLTPSIEGLSRLASRHHGLNLNYGAIAYSLRDDLSIAAVIPTTSFGSLFHELFHLMARSNFGDIPNWLDEGIASLYEVSQASADGFAGVGNWRGRVLARFREHIPSLKVLIENRGPAQPDRVAARRVPDDDPVLEAIFAATGRYFALYLQERGKLVDLYNAIRDYSTSADFDGRDAGVFRRVEAATGMSLRELDADFRRWLARQELELRNIRVDQGLERYLPPPPQ